MSTKSNDIEDKVWAAARNIRLAYPTAHTELGGSKLADVAQIAKREEEIIKSEVEKVIALIETTVTEASKRTVNRLEVIDTEGGRAYVKWVPENFNVELSDQDDGRTLKIFLTTLTRNKEVK